jgi:predicted ATPase
VLFRLATLHEVRAEFDKTQVVLGDRWRLLEGDGAVAGLVESHELMACSSFHQGRFTDALEHARRGLEGYSPPEHLGLTAFLGENPGVSCHHWSAHALWFLGYPDQAMKAIAAALGLAEDLTHWFSLAHAQEQAAWMHQHRGEAREAQRRSEAAIALADTQGFPYRRATGAILRGWARAQLGEPDGAAEEIEQGLAICRSIGARLDYPYYLALYAETLGGMGRIQSGLEALDEALAIARGSRGYFYEAELMRLRGSLLMRSDEPTPEDDAEAAYSAALAIARSQNARSLELRAATSLASLKHRRGQDRAALAMLLPRLDGFREGQTTRDLRQAATLIAEIQHGDGGTE